MMKVNDITLSISLNTSRRESNMELFRIVAMLLVMVVHADFRALGMPTVADFGNDTFRTVMRLMMGSFSIICVNTFVLLSGWFGIQFKINKLIGFLFQVSFFLILCFGIEVLISPDAALSYRGLANLLLLGDRDYWFVKSYLLMYIFAPILNAYVNNSTERQLRVFLILFYSFQSVYGFVGGAEWFRLGYSGISFMGLYMLARYIRLYPNKMTSLNKGWDITIYFLLTVLMTLLAVVVLAGELDPRLLNRVYAYTSPLVIISALFFLLFFSKIKLGFNTIINWVAASSFAIYLVHSNIWLSVYYDKTIRYLFASYSGIPFYLRTVPFILFVFVVSILSDKLRILLWNIIQPLFQRLKFLQGCDY